MSFLFFGRIIVSGILQQVESFVDACRSRGIFAQLEVDTRQVGDGCRVLRREVHRLLVLCFGCDGQRRESERGELSCVGTNLPSVSFVYRVHCRAFAPRRTGPHWRTPYRSPCRARLLVVESGDGFVFCVSELKIKLHWSGWAAALSSLSAPLSSCKRNFG